MGEGRGPSDVRSFSIKLLLMASLSWWVSGAAGFVHERMEAVEAGADAAVAPAPNSLPALGSPNGLDGLQAPKHKHSPDDCPFCRLLATMRAQPGLAFNPPIVQWVQCGWLALTPQEAPSLFQFTPIHSRGPPAA